MSKEGKYKEGKYKEESSTEDYQTKLQGYSVYLDKINKLLIGTDKFAHSDFIDIGNAMVNLQITGNKEKILFFKAKVERVKDTLGQELQSYEKHEDFTKLEALRTAKEEFPDQITEETTKQLTELEQQFAPHGEALEADHLIGNIGDILSDYESCHLG